MENDPCREALEVAIMMIEWSRPVAYEKIVEYTGGFPRYETYCRPNKKAQERANEVRRMAGLPEVDYAIDS